MKFSRFNLFLVCCPLLGFTLTALTAADASFSWTQAQGPPQKLNATCAALASCAPATGCVVVNPPVSVVPSGGTTNVLVKSYSKIIDKTYGNCDTGTPGTCYAYPNVKCAYFYIYGDTACDSSWGNAYVYAGSCSGN